MAPSSLAWILLCLQVSSSSALTLAPRGVDGQPSSGVRHPYPLLHRLFGNKRTPPVEWSPPGRSEELNWKRAPNGLGASGFYGDVFSQGFGAFSPVKRGLHAVKRRPEMTASGFYGDVFTGGIGSFDTMKRRPEMTASGFYDDVFRGGMGHFDTMKRRPEMTASGFYGDVFKGGLGHFDTMKRRPEMTASGFYDDVFSGGMGHFDTMKRTLEAGGASHQAKVVGDSLRTHSKSGQAVKGPADDLAGKQLTADESLTSKGLRGDLLPGSLSGFSTMR